MTGNRTTKGRKVSSIIFRSIYCLSVTFPQLRWPIYPSLSISYLVDSLLREKIESVQLSLPVPRHDLNHL